MIKIHLLIEVIIMIYDENFFYWPTDSGPLGSTLPAHPSHGLESERVLQAVRSNQNGKADTSKAGGAQLIGPQTQEISIVQVR